MGYPMTWQRFVKRNFLEKGEYGQPFSDGQWPQFWQQRGYVKDAFTETERREMDRANEERAELAQRLQHMAGDLRRLANDAQDENAVCRYIAQRTGLDAEKVAAVLKEFFNW